MLLYGCFHIGVSGDDPHYESRCGSTRDARVPDAELYTNLSLCCVVCAITPTAEQFQITKKCTTLALQCVYIHTHTHMRHSHGRSSFSHWQAKFSGEAKQRKGR